MPQRVEDRRPDPVIERMMQERQNDVAGRKRQVDFSKKIESQKASVEQSKSQSASNAEISKSAIRQSKDQTARALGENQSATKSKAAESSSESVAKGSNTKATTADKSQKKEVDTKREARKEEAKTAKTEKKRDEVSLEIAVHQKAEKDMNDEMGSESSDEFFQHAVNMATQSMTPPVETQGPSAPARIPDAVINQLINQVYLSIDKKGLQNLVIEFKDGVLGGGQVAVSSKDGKVSLRFSGLDAQSKSLLRNSRDEIEHRLQGKKLTLREFVIA